MCTKSHSLDRRCAKDKIALQTEWWWKPGEANEPNQKHLNDTGSLYHDPRPLHPRHFAPMSERRLGSLHGLVYLHSITRLQMAQHSPCTVKHVMVTAGKYTGEVQNKKFAQFGEATGSGAITGCTRKWQCETTWISM